VCERERERAREREKSVECEETVRVPSDSSTHSEQRPFLSCLRSSPIGSFTGPNKWPQSDRFATTRQVFTTSFWFVKLFEVTASRDQISLYCLNMKDVLVDYVCPSLGVLISNAMFFSPWSLIMKARKNRHLGNVNPLPYAVMFNTQLGYVIYGSMQANYFIFFGAVLGVLCSLFYCITCLTIMAKEAIEDEFTDVYMLIEGLIIGGVGMWSLICIVQNTIFTGFDDPLAQGEVLVGYLSCFFNVCYYASPLSTMYEVITKKDASSFYLPNIIVNSLNATLWLLYGALGVNNPVVWAPSAIGLVLSLIQIALVFMYHQGHWLEAASGWITHRTIQIKTRLGADDENSQLESMMPSTVSSKYTVVVTSSTN
jgi:solute carrier family 50 (sugar transporter)